MPQGRLAAVLVDRWLLLMLLAGGVMAFVVVAVIGFSGALYTSQSTSPGNEFAAGSIDLAIEKDGQLFDADGLLPGEHRTAQQTVTNIEHKAAITLTATDLATGDPLAAVLVVTVHQTAPERAQPVWSGSLAGLDAVPLGTFSAAEQRSYRIDLDWPEDQTDPSLQGARVSFDFAWAAESVP